jgi:hypothetical protein
MGSAESDVASGSARGRVPLPAACDEESGFLPARGHIARIYPSQAIPPFDAPDELTSVWGRAWGASDEVGPLRTVLMRRPGPEFEEMKNGRFDPELGLLVDPAGFWYWNGAEPPDVDRVRTQHAGLVNALEAEGVEVVFAEELSPPPVQRPVHP